MAPQHALVKVMGERVKTRMGKDGWGKTDGERRMGKDGWGKTTVGPRPKSENDTN